MSRCNSEGSSLDSIKLVSDNLSERVKLDCSNSGEYYEENDTLSDVRLRCISTHDYNTVYKKDSSKFSGNWSASLKLLDNKSTSVAEGAKEHSASKLKIMTDMTMNSNLMFRSMFFMNDEATRHFLAPPLPPIQPCDIQSEYFQKKLISQGTSTPGPSSVTTSSTNTGNISAPTNSTATEQSPSGGTPEKPSLTLPKQRPHNCEECGKTFLMKHHLSTHMRVHTGERPHVCPECGKSFALKHCLSTHLLLHTADRPYKCNECNKSFTLKHHLVSHERVHTRDRPFECPECGQRFPQKRHLSTHIKFHSGERPFSCQVCGESFSREEHLVMHSRFHGGLSPYNCPDCGAGFLRKFELVNHERQHGRNPESCPTCGKEFLQKRTLLVHVRSCGLGTPTSPSTQQSTSPPRFSEGTPSRFSDNTPPRFSDGSSPRFPNDNNSPRFSENSNQFRFLEGSPPMRFADGTPTSSSPMSMQTTKDKVCKECGETFASMEGLALHLRLHFGDHSFLADICSLAASLKQTAVNVATSLKKTHICADCGRGFTQRHGLFQHRQRHANGSCKEKPFSCEKCGKSFSQKNHLTLHERQHMDLPRNGSMLKNQMQKGPHSSSDDGRMEDQQIESSSGESSQRSLQDSDRKDLERAMANSMMLQQNHPDHQRVDMLNRHATESLTGESNQQSSQSENRKEMERAMANSMMQNHTDRQRVDLLNRHAPESHRSLNTPVALVRVHNNTVTQSSSIQQGSSSDRPMLPHHHRMEDQQIESSSGESSQRGLQDSDRKDLERAMANSMLLQQNHPDHQRVDMLNRHTTEVLSGENNQQSSQSENRKEMERAMANSMMQNHPDRLLNRHIPEPHRSLNNPVALIRVQNNRVTQSGSIQPSSDRPMLPHHHHMAVAPPSEQIMPCLHPVPNKQY